MSNPQKEQVKLGEVLSTSPATAAIEGGRDIFYSTGRRGVRIFGLPPDQMAIATIVSILLGVPFALIVAMAPFWDWVGDLAVLKEVNFYIAPGLDNLAYGFRVEALPRFPLKRFLVASECMVLLILLGNVVALFRRKVRKHALLVWLCYDRKKVILQFSIASLLFIGLWYVFFVDWRVLIFFGASRRGITFVLYMVVALPVVSVLFGHLAAIIGMGLVRNASKMLRRFRTISPSSINVCF